MKAVAVVLLALAAVALAAPLQEAEYETLFSSWVNTHGKVYDSVEAFFKRYTIWKNNMNYIIAHSARNKTYTLAMNAFGDLTNEEFTAQYNNYVRAPNAPTCLTANLSAVQPLDSIDWRTKGAVTPVKNQGQCGSCWAFSTTGSTEGAVFLKTGKLVSLSEQQLVDCSGSQGNEGCNGGMMQNAFTWIVQNGGITSEAQYPYTAQDGTCNTGVSEVSHIAGCENVTPNDSNALRLAVSKQPVSVAVDAGGMDWQFYSSGVLSDSGCGTQLDHGVLAAGYGSLNGQDYWLVKNSWGTSWGMSGYILILRSAATSDPGECGIAQDNSYPVA